MSSCRWRSLTVAIPARNEAGLIGEVVRAVLTQRPRDVDVEVVVVDNASDDATADVARDAGARVLSLPLRDGRGNPAAARNLAARLSESDAVIFLDADCIPRAGWLGALLEANADGASIIGGPLALPVGLSSSARADYYCGWYHMHEARPAGPVVSHPPCNLAVERALFMRTSGFIEDGPAAYAHEELRWQSELAQAGYAIHFAPRAVVDHVNRPGLANLLKRNYRWGYSAVQTKAETGAARAAWVYRYPRLLLLALAPLALVQTLYVLGCWLRIGRLEPLWMLPLILAARCAWSAGAIVGTTRWLDNRARGTTGTRPVWE